MRGTITDMYLSLFVFMKKKEIRNIWMTHGLYVND